MTMKPSSSTLQIILTGASGYLGQHLLSSWMTNGIVHSQPLTTSSSDGTGTPCHDHRFPSQIRILALYHNLPGFEEAVQNFPCSENVQVTVKSLDLTNPDDMQALKETLFSEPNDDNETITGAVVVVHTAALSSPRICQQHPDKATAMNVPIHFFEAVSDYPMIALSTDQVYIGNGKQQNGGSMYQETDQDKLKPVNAYGQSKLDMEQYLLQDREQESSPLLFLLRSSIILGPPGPLGGAHTTFLDFCHSQGQKNEATTFFTNEYRSVVSVQDVINVITNIISYCCFHKNKDNTSIRIPSIYNLGGPQRVNRWDMAKAVFDYFGYDETLLLKAEQTSEFSPLDISMDSSLLKENNFGKSVHTTLDELVHYTFASRDQ